MMNAEQSYAGSHSRDIIKSFYNRIAMKPFTEHFIKSWHITAVLMISCGLAAFVIAHFFPARYTATAFLSFSIDHNQTGSLTDLEEDRMIGITEDIIKSDEVFAEVCRNMEGCTKEGFLNRIQLDRTNNQWYMSVSGEDPQESAAMASVWLDEAYTVLQRCLRAALEERGLKEVLNNLVLCFENSVSGSLTNICPSDTAILFKKIEEISAEIMEKQRLAKGISPAIVLGEKRNVPGDIPVVRSNATTGFLTLLGLLIGFLISLLLCLMKPGVSKELKTDCDPAE